MIVVRKGQPADANAIGAVHVRAWQVGYRGIAPDAYLDGLSVPERVAMWERQIPELTPNQVLFVAERSGVVVGFGGGGPDRRPTEGGGGCELYMLNVDPEHWSTGTGSALLAAFNAWCIEQGARELVLWVVHENERARRFYERRGLSWDGTLEDADVLGVSFRECRYRKTLP